MTQEQIQIMAEDPKAFLMRGRAVHKRIAAKFARIENWRGLAESITARLKHDAGVSGGGYKQSLIENSVVNIISLQEEILAEIDVLVAVEKEIREVINVFIVDDKQKTVLEMRYLNGYAWDEIAGALSYTEDWAYKLHGAAIKTLRKKVSI